MSTFLNRSATSQSSSYPIVFTRLGGPRSRPNSQLKLQKCRGSNPRPRDQKSDMLTTRPTRRSMYYNYNHYCLEIPFLNKILRIFIFIFIYLYVQYLFIFNKILLLLFLKPPLWFILCYVANYEKLTWWLMKSGSLIHILSLMNLFL